MNSVLESSLFVPTPAGRAEGGGGAQPLLTQQSYPAAPPPPQALSHSAI